MSDYIVRATAADAQIRAFAATTRDMVEYARSVHGTSPVMTAALGRLLTAGAMMGSMLKGEKDLVTLQIVGDGEAGQLLVTADAMARVKGYASNPSVMLPPNAMGKLDVGGAIGHGYLRVLKDMGLKEPYAGETELVSGEIAEDLTYYFANSEQVPSSVGLGVLMNKDNTVAYAGGFIIQLMPFADDAVINKLEEKLMGLNSVTTLLKEGNSPEDILNIILGDMDLVINDKTETSFYCNCERERVEKALISLGKKELKEMIEEGKPIETKCHFCNTTYAFDVEELKALMKQSR